MIKFTTDGKQVNPEDFGDKLMLAAVEKVKEQLYEHISVIRRPDTGEFPTVQILGGTLQSISARVEGSPELLTLVRERVAPEDLNRMTLIETHRVSRPKGFLSFAWENRELARRIAETLHANGVEIWWSEWEISAGDSLRQKIDLGLSDCTHFLVLLTPQSIGKAWLNQEMDAGLVRKIENQARFIALRSDLPVSALPPLLKGLYSPSLDNFERDIRQLLHDIHGISRKPPLGPAPTIANGRSSRYSAAATAVAQIFVQESQDGVTGDPMLTLSDLCDRTSLSQEDVQDALYELDDMVDGDPEAIFPKGEIFASFDVHFRDWNPAADAVILAADLVNDDSFPREPHQIAKRYGWPPRRLNPAIAYLANRNLITSLTSMGMQPWSAFHIEKTDATRRFVKSRS